MMIGPGPMIRIFRMSSRLGMHPPPRAAPQIGLLDLGVGEKAFGPSLQHEPAVLQYIPSTGKLKGHSSILLDDQNGGSFPIDLPKGVDNTYHQQGRPPHGGLSQDH